MAKKTQSAVTEQNPPAGGRWVRLPDGTLVRPEQAAAGSEATAAPAAGQTNETETEKE